MRAITGFVILETSRELRHGRESVSDIENGNCIDGNVGSLDLLKMEYMLREWYRKYTDDSVEVTMVICGGEGKRVIRIALF